MVCLSMSLYDQDEGTCAERAASIEGAFSNRMVNLMPPFGRYDMAARIIDSLHGDPHTAEAHLKANSA